MLRFVGSHLTVRCVIGVEKKERLVLTGMLIEVVDTFTRKVIDRVLLGGLKLAIVMQMETGRIRLNLWEGYSCE